MQTQYVYPGFKNLDEFLTYHREQARKGDEASQGIVATAERIELAKLDQKAKERAG